MWQIKACGLFNRKSILWVKEGAEKAVFTFYDCCWYDQWEQVVHFLINEMKQKSGANEVTNEVTGNEDRGSLRFLGLGKPFLIWVFSVLYCARSVHSFSQKDVKKWTKWC